MSATFALVAYGGAGPLHAVAGRARDRHAHGHHPARAGRVLAPSACCSPICATISCAPGSRGSTTPIFDEIETHLWRARGRRAARRRRRPRSRAERRRRSSAPPTCAMSARSMPSRSTCRSRSSRARDRAAIKRAFRRAARAPLRHLRAGGARRDRQPAHHRHRRHAQAAAGKDRRPAAARRASRLHRQAHRSISARHGGCLETPTYARARLARRQPHRRAGAGRGACLDHRACRPGDRLEVDAFGNLDDRGRGKAVMKPTASQQRAGERARPIRCVTEIVRNGVIAVTEEMKTNLMRTAYNMIIYEALDFTTGLFTADGRDRLDRHRPADVHPRHGRDDQGEAQAFRPRRDRAGRHPRHQRRLHHRQPSQPRHPDPADLPQAACWSASPAAWRIGSISAARSAASPPTSIPKGCRSRS